jgi:GH24 family phage-related lysozyme (muramidase)
MPRPTPRRTAVTLALAAAIAVPAEGLRQVAYRDPPGILTVCYGSTTNVQPGRVYSLSECKARLESDMLSAIATVEQCAPNLPENVLAAFSDAVYNLGPAIACDRNASTAARMLSSGDIAGACGQLVRWDKARVAGALIALPGLTKRRRTEYELCIQKP